MVRNVFFKVPNLDVKVFYVLKKNKCTIPIKKGLCAYKNRLETSTDKIKGRASAEKIEFNKIINFQGTEIEKINIKITKRNLEFSVKIKNVKKYI